MGKKLRSLVLFFLFATCLAACTKKTTAENELVIAISAAPPTLDPRITFDATGIRLIQLMFNGLVALGSDLKLKGDAVSEWRLDGNTYTFDLVPGLKFHNGRLVDKDDLQFSYEQFTSKSSGYSSSFELVEKFQAIQERDHVRVRITLKKPSINWIYKELPIFKILPKREISTFQQTLMGSGSYRFISKSDNEIVLQAIADHPVETPKIPNLIFKVIRDDFTRYQKLMKGEIDGVLTDLAPDKVKVFQKHADQFTVFRYLGTSFTYLLLNMKDPMVANRDFRKALSQAINRPELIEYKLEGLAKEATSLLPLNHPFFDGSLINPSFNLGEAKHAIEQLGFKGRKLILKTANNPAVIDVSRVIAYSLSKSGVTVDLQSFEWGKFYSDIRGGNFQAAIMKWPVVIDPDIYRIAFHTNEKPPGRNRGSYSNKELDQLLEKAAASLDDNERNRLYRQIQQTVFNDYAILPLWYEEQVAVFRKNVRGYEPSQMGNYVPLMKVSKQN